MLTKEKNYTVTPRIPDDIEEVEYPPEVIERLEKELEIAELQIAIGELVPKTAAEMAAEWGIKLG